MVELKSSSLELGGGSSEEVSNEQRPRRRVGKGEAGSTLQRQDFAGLRVTGRPARSPPSLEAASHLGQPVVELLFLFTRYLSPGFPSGPAGVSLSTVGQPELFWKDVDLLLHVEQTGWKTFHHSLTHSLTL